LIPYRATLDVPHELVEHVSWLIYARRCERGTRWRKLGCFHQALLALVHLRKNETLPQLAAGFGVSTATAWVCRRDPRGPGLLGARTAGGPRRPGRRGLRHRRRHAHPPRPRRRGPAVLLPKAPQARHERPGRRTTGRNPAVVVPRNPGPHPRPDRGPRPRHRPACLTRQILVLADRAYQGAGATFRTPYYYHSEQPEPYQQFNRDHARLRAPGERAFAQLKTWRLLQRARCSTRRIGTAVQAVHTLLTCTYSG
jgi:hypothetical protein